MRPIDSSGCGTADRGWLACGRLAACIVAPKDTPIRRRRFFVRQRRGTPIWVARGTRSVASLARVLLSRPELAPTQPEAPPLGSQTSRVAREAIRQVAP